MRALASLASIMTACALTSRAPPTDVRYFSPQITAQPLVTPCNAAIRIAKWSSSAHLRYRVTRRRSAVEVSLVDRERWTEYPETYVRRSFGRMLGVHQAYESATSVTVNVLAFDDVERAGRRFGRVELEYEISNESKLVGRGVVVAERAALAPDMLAVVEALSQALDAASKDLLEQVFAAMNCR
jgi:hypothetical protein